MSGKATQLQESDGFLKTLASQYREALLDDVIPFWLRHAPDPDFGGYQFCLDRRGMVIDPDKGVWTQARFSWMLSTLYNQVEKRPEWLGAARLGIDFLEKHCFAPDGKMYFLVSRDGRPLRMRRHFFSESFAAIAFASYARASGDDFYRRRAVEIFERFVSYSMGRVSLPPKWDPEVRPMRSLAVAMIAISTAQVLREDINLSSAGEVIDWGINQIKDRFYRPDRAAVFEIVGSGGELYDTFDGRLLNPGHALEAAWFILREAERRNNAEWRDMAIGMIDCMWERGWDETYGGLRYFADVDGKPIQEYWHDMKFWWPHNEAEIAALLAWRMTGELRFKRRLEEVHQYQFSLFPDPEFGEWFGYFHRDGRLSSEVKGNHWKGGFHLPRMLFYCWKLAAGRAI